MTQSILGSRKRGRCEGDEESRDFTPLSKRINNLHIHNGAHCSNHKSTLDENRPESPPDLHWQAATNGLSNGNNSHGNSSGQAQLLNHQHTYSPNLTVAENPFYYEPNKLLYYLYIERMQRSGQDF